MSINSVAMSCTTTVLTDMFDATAVALIVCVHLVVSGGGFNVGDIASNVNSSGNLKMRPIREFMWK